MSADVQARRFSVGSRVVRWGHLALLALYLCGSFGVLLAAVARTGDHGALLEPGLERLGDPKDSLPSFGPLTWIFGVGRVVAMFGYPVLFLMLTLGTAALLRTATTKEWPEFRRLAVLTAIWLGLTVIALTSYGQKLHTWLLD